MNWSRFTLVVFIASVLTSLSDWLFMGALFHDKYRAAPEIWRSSTGSNERRLIICSQLVGVLSSVAFVFVCMQANALTMPRSVGLAVVVWLAGPLVVITQMVMWIKLHPLIGASHSVGWLVRFLVTGVVAAWLL